MYISQLNECTKDLLNVWTDMSTGRIILFITRALHVPDLQWEVSESCWMFGEWVTYHHRHNSYTFGTIDATANKNNICAKHALMHSFP